MKYSVFFTLQAKDDIKQAKIYYNNQQKGLGKRFYKTVIAEAKLLSSTPNFALRYSNIRCFPVRGFPFMFHFSVSEIDKTVRVYAVIHTSQNPDKRWILTQ